MFCFQKIYISFYIYKNNFLYIPYLWKKMFLAVLTSSIHSLTIFLISYRSEQVFQIQILL